MQPEYFSSYFNAPRLEMIQFVPVESRRVLDIGCGEGIFGEHLKRKIDCEIWGVEIDERAVKVAEEKYDTVLHGDFLSLKKSLPVGNFDCIVMNDILEHFANPSEILLNIRELLTKNGKIVFSIPNVRYIENLYELIILKDWRYKTSGVLDEGHLRFYTKKSIIRLFFENEYKVEEITAIHRFFSRRLFRYFYCFINFLTFNYFQDIGYLQFAGIASCTHKK